MNRYNLYNLIIESDLDFPQLTRNNDFSLSADISIVSGAIPEYIYESESQNIHYNFGIDESWLINNSIYIYVSNGNKITYKLKEGSRYHRTYLLGWGMSMICYERQTPAIHCSAITDGQYAYLLAGESGSGKSTISDKLLEDGFRFLADDVTLVDIDNFGIPYANPCFPYRKLCRDAALNSGYNLDELIYIDEDKDKFLVPSHSLFCDKPMPIKSLIVLGINNTEEINLKKLEGMEVLHACIGNLFLRHLLDDKKFNPDCVKPCLKIASKIDSYYISRPCQKDTLNEMLSYIKDIIK